MGLAISLLDDAGFYLKCHPDGIQCADGIRLIWRSRGSLPKTFVSFEGSSYHIGREEIAMANTYTQVFIHYVIATKHRMRFLTAEIQQEIYAYSAGLIKTLNCFLQGIGGMDDHLHLLVGLHPTLAVSELAQKFKANTSRFINEKGWYAGKFQWQEGFGAFSVSQSGLEQVRKYIRNQAEHHRRQSFAGEYEELLAKYGINYDKLYLFEPSSET